MKVAIIGSRQARAGTEELDKVLPEGTSEIVSGGARGVDQDGARYAVERGLPLTEFLPDYKRYGRGAPLKRNEAIAEYADRAVAFWDGESRGTKHAIEEFRKRKKEVTVIIVKPVDGAL